MVPLGHAPFLGFNKKSLRKCSKVNFRTVIGLTNLLHRTYANNGMAGQSRVGRSSVLISDSTVTTWNISSPTRCLVLWGRQFCSPLVSPSEQLQETLCQRTDKHVLLPRSCQLPLQSRECGICIKDKHKPLLSIRGTNLPFPTCWKIGRAHV